MTHNEAIILSAYTGFLLVEDFSEVHKFCEELLGRPIFTSEFANDFVIEEIREKCKPLIFEMQKPKTNFERIKAMSVEEFSIEFEIGLCTHIQELDRERCEKYSNCSKCRIEWLEAEE